MQTADARIFQISARWHLTNCAREQMVPEFISSLNRKLCHLPFCMMFLCYFFGCFVADAELDRNTLFNILLIDSIGRCTECGNVTKPTRIKRLNERWIHSIDDNQRMANVCGSFSKIFSFLFFRRVLFCFFPKKINLFRFRFYSTATTEPTTNDIVKHHCYFSK